MNSPQHEATSGVVPASPVPESRFKGLLLSCDLIFTTKIRATADSLGHQIQVVSDPTQVESLIIQLRPRLVLFDLSARDLCAPSQIQSVRKLAGLDVWLVAFGSHIDADALAAAKIAGCQAAIPRSRFTSELPALLQRYLSQSPTANPPSRS
jgi:hypothetical protein